MLKSSILVIFPFCMAFAAVSDLLSMTIANRVSILLVAAFAIIAPFTGMNWVEYAMHFAAGGLVLIATFALFAIGAMGGGDAKLLPATAVWMGLGIPLVQYLVFASVLGGVLTLGLILYRRSAMAVFTGNNLFLRNLADERAGIPYGIALGISGLLVYPDTVLMQWALDRLA